MAVSIMRLIDNKKYMWDGRLYDTEGAAREKEASYKGQGFETRLVPVEDNKFAVYTRRVPTTVTAS